MRSEARKKALGEVFTPPKLVEEMLDRLSQDVWSDPSKTFLDPTCGNGNFLVAVIAHKIASGSTPLQALGTTYGCDIMQDNVDDCRKRLLKQAEESSGLKREKEWVWTVIKNIVCHDSLTYNFDFEDTRNL